MRTGCIYVLVDPITLLVRYVGQTVCLPTRRYAQHVYQWKRARTSHVNSWIKSLSLKGLLPILEIVEDEVLIDQLDNKEVFYIKLYKSFGAKLCNHAEGGRVNRGMKMSEESKEKRRNTQKTSKVWKDRGAKHSETLKKIHAEGNYLFGYGHLPEEKRRKIGKKHSEKMKQLYRTGKLKNTTASDAVKKPVLLLNDVGEILQSFESAAEAARILGIPDSTHVCRVCKGKSSHAYRMKFCYLKDYKQLC